MCYFPKVEFVVSFLRQFEVIFFGVPLLRPHGFRGRIYGVRSRVDMQYRGQEQHEGIDVFFGVELEQPKAIAPPQADLGQPSATALVSYSIARLPVALTRRRTPRPATATSSSL